MSGGCSFDWRRTQNLSMPMLTPSASLRLAASLNLSIKVLCTQYAPWTNCKTSSSRMCGELGTTSARGRSPSTWSLTLTTAASSTSGCSRSTDSSSVGDTYSVRSACGSFSALQACYITWHVR